MMGYNGGSPVLIGGIPTLLKNMKVSWDDAIPNIRKNKVHVQFLLMDVLFNGYTAAYYSQYMEKYSKLKL